MHVRLHTQGSNLKKTGGWKPSVSKKPATTKTGPAKKSKTAPKVAAKPALNATKLNATARTAAQKSSYARGPKKKISAFKLHLAGSSKEGKRASIGTAPHMDPLCAHTYPAAITHALSRSVVRARSLALSLSLSRAPFLENKNRVKSPLKYVLLWCVLAGSGKCTRRASIALPPANRGRVSALVSKFNVGNTSGVLPPTPGGSATAGVDTTEADGLAGMLGELSMFQDTPRFASTPVPYGSPAVANASVTTPAAVDGEGITAVASAAEMTPGTSSTTSFSQERRQELLAADKKRRLTAKHAEEAKESLSMSAIQRELEQIEAQDALLEEQYVIPGEIHAYIHLRYAHSCHAQVVAGCSHPLVSIIIVMFIGVVTMWSDVHSHRAIHDYIDRLP